MMKKWKKIIAAWIAAGMLPVCPVHLLAQSETVNIAAGKHVYAKGDAQAVTDGSLETAYSPADGENIVIDLGRAYPLERVKAQGENLDGAVCMASNDKSFGPSGTAQYAVQNVSQGKPIRSKLYGEGGYLTYIARNANDGDIGTDFIATPVSKNDIEWLTVDLQKPHAVEYAEAVFSKSTRKFSIFVTNELPADGEELTDGIALVKSGGKYYLPAGHKGEKFRYARIRFQAGVLASQKDIYLSEFSIFANVQTVQAPPAMTAGLSGSGGEFRLSEGDRAQFYRYILLRGTGAAMSVSEIEVYTPKAQTRLEESALGKPVSAYAGAEIWPDFPLEQAVDGREDTFCALNCHLPYIQIDLGRPMDISHVEVLCRRDLLSDRQNIRIQASNNMDFDTYYEIGFQGGNEEIGLEAWLVRVNANRFEQFRYIRVFEGDTFLVLAEIKVFTGGQGGTELTDAAGGVLPVTADNSETAYRITDGDGRTSWSGQSFTLDLGHCYPLAGFSASGAGDLRIIAALDEKLAAGRTFLQTIQNTGSCYIQADGGYARYIRVESADGGSLEITDFRAFTPAASAALVNVAKNARAADGAVYYASETKEDKLTDGNENNACAFTTGTPGYVTFDLGRQEIISHVEVVTSKVNGGELKNNENLRVELSNSPGFEHKVLFAEHAEPTPLLSVWPGASEPSAARYVRVYASSGYFEVGEIYIMAYAHPEMRIVDGKLQVNFPAEQYMRQGANAVVLSLYDAQNKLISANADRAVEAPGGGIYTIETGLDDFSAAKLLVWNSLGGMEPHSPAVNLTLDAEEVIQETFYVDIAGKDGNDGSRERPFRTIEAAQTAVRKISGDMYGDIVIYIGAGKYNIEDPLAFIPADGGTNGYRVIYKNRDAQRPVISGGKPIPGFTAGENGIWQAYAPEFDGIYALMVNGRQAKIAQTEQEITAEEFFSAGWGYQNDGLYIASSVLPGLSNPEDVYLHYIKSWMDSFLRVKDIQIEGGRSKVTMVQPYFEYAADHDFMATLPIQPDTPFTVENAFELLDSPGEFYFNRKTKMLYYMPRAGEDMSTAVVEAPVVDELVRIRGDGVENHIQGLTLDGLAFENADFQPRYRFGQITSQAQRMRLSNYKDFIIPGTIQIDYATDIEIQNCTVTGVTTTAVSLGEGVLDSRFAANEIFDVGDGAFAVGRPWHAVIEQPNESGMYDCYGRKAAWASSGDIYKLYDQKSESILSTGGTWNPWVSHVSDVNLGIKPWVILDLEKPYSIHDVELLFGSEPQKNFEILASNDESFTDYVVLGNQGSVPSGSVFRSGGSGGEKYRFIKIQKTVLEQFKIYGVNVWTADESLHQIEELCAGNVIAENTIRNTAQKHWAAPAITAYYVQNTQILYNSITNSSYSAISLGWGWMNTPYSVTCRNNRVANNYIRDFNQKASDGAGIYTLSQQSGTVIEGNYIVQRGQPSQNYSDIGLYPDEGSAYITIRNNVIDMTEGTKRYAVMMWIDTVRDNVAHTNYGTYTRIRNDGTNCILDDIIPYDRSNPPAAVREIIENTKLTDDAERG